MQTEIIVALVGVAGALLGAIITQLLTHRKTEAEIDKLKAETEKARAESDKLRAEMVQLSSPSKNKIEMPKAEQVRVAPATSANLGTVSFGEYKQHPTPAEIMTALDNLPEYQKHVAVEGYQGVKVKWYLMLLSLSFKDDLVELLFNSKDAGMVGISCTVKIADYPELKLLKKNHKIIVSGKISRVLSGMGIIINLSDCTLEID